MHSFRIRSSSNSSLAGRQTVFVTSNHTTHVADFDQLFHRHVMSYHVCPRTVAGIPSSLLIVTVRSFNACPYFIWLIRMEPLLEQLLDLRRCLKRSSNLLFLIYDINFRIKWVVSRYVLCIFPLLDYLQKTFSIFERNIDKSCYHHITDTFKYDIIRVECVNPRSLLSRL